MSKIHGWGFSWARPQPVFSRLMRTTCSVCGSEIPKPEEQGNVCKGCWEKMERVIK
jgi:hypothetical protein